MNLDFGMMLAENARPLKKLDNDSGEREYLKERYYKNDVYYGLGMETFDIWRWATVYGLKITLPDQKKRYLNFYYSVLNRYMDYVYIYCRLHNGSMKNVQIFEKFWTDSVVNRKIISLEKEF